MKCHKTAVEPLQNIFISNKNVIPYYIFRIGKCLQIGYEINRLTPYFPLANSNYKYPLRKGVFVEAIITHPVIVTFVAGIMTTAGTRIIETIPA